MKYIVFALLTAAAFFGNSAQASFECYLKIQGVLGESTAEGHTNDITIESFAFDVSNAGGSLPQRSDLLLTKLLDKASPILALKCADGTMFQDATITCRSTDPGRPIFYRLTLAEVTVTQVTVQGNASLDNRPHESVALRFAAMRWEYYPIKPDGSQGTVVRGGWDFARNRPF